MNFRIDVSNFYRTGTLINKSFDIVFTNVLKQYGGFPEASLPNNKAHAQRMVHGYYVNTTWRTAAHTDHLYLDLRKTAMLL
jgi:hypothetical protein